MEQPVIPVRNIYYMLTYAWGYLQEIKQADLEAIPGNNLLDILGYVLNKGVLQLSRRGLELDYNPNTEIIPGIGNDSNLLIVFYVQIMPDDFVMQLHRF